MEVLEVALTVEVSTPMDLRRYWQLRSALLLGSRRQHGTLGSDTEFLAAGRAFLFFYQRGLIFFPLVSR